MNGGILLHNNVVRASALLILLCFGRLLQQRVELLGEQEVREMVSLHLDVKPVNRCNILESHDTGVITQNIDPRWEETLNCRSSSLLNSCAMASEKQIDRISSLNHLSIYKSYSRLLRGGQRRNLVSRIRLQ